MEFSYVETADGACLDIIIEETHFQVIFFLTTSDDAWDGTLAEVIFFTPCCDQEASCIAEIEDDDNSRLLLYCPECDTIVSGGSEVPPSVFLLNDTQERLLTIKYFERKNDIFESILLASELENFIGSSRIIIEKHYRVLMSMLPSLENEAYMEAQRAMRELAIKTFVEKLV